MRKRVASLRADDAGRSVHGLRKGEEEREVHSDEGEKRAREKTRRRKSIGGRWKEKHGGRRTRGGAVEGYAAERWWIEEGRRRVGSGVEGLPGWRGTEAGGGGGPVRREGGRGEDLRSWKTHPFSCLPSLAV